jgi:hypothetical protein
VRARVAAVAVALSWTILSAAPPVAAEPQPGPHPARSNTAHPPTPVPVHPGGRWAGGLPGIDGRVVALGSVLGLGVLVGILGLRRD